MAQASFDAYMLPRHVGLYAGVPQETPAHMVQRVCGTGIEVLAQASDATSLGRAELALCVGTESMTRNPVAAYTLRGGFRMGQTEFKDFLWEALRDTGPDLTMGDTAENLAKQYQITRAAGGRIRGALVRARGEGAGRWLPRRRDRARDDGEVRGRRAQRARHQGEGRVEGRHPHPAIFGRAAGENPPGLRRRADRRQFVGHRRRRRGHSGGHRGLRAQARQEAAGAHPGGGRGRRAAGDHGHRPGAGNPRRAGARRA